MSGPRPSTASWCATSWRGAVGHVHKVQSRIFDDGHSRVMVVGHYFGRRHDVDGNEERYRTWLDRVWIHKGTVWLLFFNKGVRTRRG